MRREYALELRFDTRWLAGARKLLPHRCKKLGCLQPAFLFCDLQHIGKVALDGRLDGFVALNVMQVPDTKRHQGRRRKDDGELQSKEQLSTVSQTPLLGHPSPLQVHS